MSHRLPTAAVDAAITKEEEAALASGSAVPPKQAAGAAATARAAATLPQPGPAAATPGSQLSSAARTQAQAPGGEGLPSRNVSVCFWHRDEQYVGKKEKPARTSSLGLMMRLGDSVG